MDSKLEILRKLIEFKVDGYPKSSFGKSESIKSQIAQLLKDGLIKEKKVKNKIFLQITEKGEIEFIKESSGDQKLELINQSLNNIKESFESNFGMIKKILESLLEKSKEIIKEIDIDSEIYKVYKELSNTTYSYLKGLVPIPSIISSIIQKFNLSQKDIHRAIYELYLKGDVIFEMGDKKEGNLETPDGKKYYYLRFKKWRNGKRFY